MTEKVNRGKDFEEVIRKAFEKVKDCSIDRVNDNLGGYKGVRGICDFIVYKCPHEMYLECKCCYGNTFNFHNITETQWNGLLEKSKIPGVIAGVILWMIDKDYTMFIPIIELERMKQCGYKSVNYNYIKDIDHLEIHGIKKRVFFDYDMNMFLIEVPLKNLRK